MSALPFASPFTLPFALRSEPLAQRLTAFHGRPEVAWLGLAGRFESEGMAVVRFDRLTPGHLGGAGTDALNGGLIATGFDAACVLAALGHVDTEVVATLTLQVQYLRRAMASPSLIFRAGATKAARSVVFVHAVLEDPSRGPEPLAVAQATLAPVRTRTPLPHKHTVDSFVGELSPLPG
jgi:acyl-coenzyme A thioesterase PaaI-like protein